MEVLREFLESSTIHGISHISTSKVFSFNFQGGTSFSYLIFDRVSCGKSSGQGWLAYAS